MKILVVDDSPIQQKIAAHCLAGLGEITLSNSVKEATVELMRSLKSNVPFDFIALDFNLGDGNGLELVGVLRKLEEAFCVKACKIIFITGTLDRDALEQQCTVNETVLAKPMILKKVLEKLQELKIKID